MVYKFFSCSTNIPRGLSAYNPQKLVVYCLMIVILVFLSLKVGFVFLFSNVAMRIVQCFLPLYLIETLQLRKVRNLLLQLRSESIFTALFNNMRTLKFKAQPTNALFATVNQMFGGSSQLSTTAEQCSTI